MVFPLSMLRPRREKTQFTIITVVGQPHLGTDEQNFLVVDNNSAIVNDVLVDNGPGEIFMFNLATCTTTQQCSHPEIANDAHCFVRRQYLGQNFP